MFEKSLLEVSIKVTKSQIKKFLKDEGFGAPRYNSEGWDEGKIINRSMFAKRISHKGPITVYDKAEKQVKRYIYDIVKDISDEFDGESKDNIVVFNKDAKKPLTIRFYTQTLQSYPNNSDYDSGYITFWCVFEYV